LVAAWLDKLPHDTAAGRRTGGVTTVHTTVDPDRVIGDLRELAAATGNRAGAQRECWSAGWTEARSWLTAKIAEIGLRMETDEAGNLWATLPGDSQHAVIVGSHIDSVPDGGWLDGALGVLAGVEVLRRLTAEGGPPVTVRLVDFADEEGTRFGRSLWGSSCVSGNIDLARVANLTDRSGETLQHVLANYGVDASRATAARSQLDDAAAYVELHIEQGPVLEESGLPVGVVLGTYGVNRARARFTGRAAHESWPLALRQDAFAAAARAALLVRDLARESQGFATVGSVVTRPGYVTAVAGECEATFDQRNFDPGVLAGTVRRARRLIDAIAAEERVEVEWQPLWEIPPIHFHPELVERAVQAVEDQHLAARKLASGPLHDAAEMARAGVPTAMLFAPSIDGISHCRAEDTELDDIRVAVRALDRLVTHTIAWVQDRTVTGERG
jgi:hydantoinase/carbamoylase family amidase